MNWIKNKPATEKEKDLIFTDGKQIYFGKKNFQDKWQDYQLGIVDGITAWTDQIPEAPVFINEKPLNDDYKGWEHEKAPIDGSYFLVADKDSNINIARFDSGWFDRKGLKLENVMCAIPILPA